jgi:hypothetical protein
MTIHLPQSIARKNRGSENKKAKKNIKRTFKLKCFFICKKNNKHPYKKGNIYNK